MKNWNDMTAEEKTAHAKAQATWKEKRAAEVKELFASLEVELEVLGAPTTITTILAKLKPLVTGGGQGKRETYLTAIFGTEEPADGTTVTYNMVGARGKTSGERMKEGEDFGAYVARLYANKDELLIKYDSMSIGKMVNTLKKRGHIITCDNNTATVTLTKRNIADDSDDNTEGAE
jgi:hypothetical protein